MADSVDRVFVHALNTVKRLPKTGSLRPPPSDRLRLYGLYKQAMEGDVDGVMERPSSVIGSKDTQETEDLAREREKWDAWDAQRGVGKTEAKRRYIEALIDTMHKYASNTTDARELVAELEFVWDQIKNNSASSGRSRSSNGSPNQYNDSQPVYPRRFEQPRSGNDGPMRVLSPMSQDDIESQKQYNDQEDDELEGGNFGEQDPHDMSRETKKWRKSVEQVLVKMTAEMAALREQVATGREYRGQRRRTPRAWITWFAWVFVKHVTVDALILGILLLSLRKKKDRRLEDLLREWLRAGRAYVRRILPAR